LKKVLPHLINNDQTGFLKSRFIGENISLINSVIDYAEKQNIPGLLLFVDFEKAFDTLEWIFAEKTLSFYNFGESIKSWIKLLYTNITSCIQNNGWSISINFTNHLRKTNYLQIYLKITKKFTQRPKT